MPNTCKCLCYFCCFNGQGFVIQNVVVFRKMTLNLTFSFKCSTKRELADTNYEYLLLIALL